MSIHRLHLTAHHSPLRIDHSQVVICESYNCGTFEVVTGDRTARNSSRPTCHLRRGGKGKGRDENSGSAMTGSRR